MPTTEKSVYAIDVDIQIADVAPGSIIDPVPVLDILAEPGSLIPDEQVTFYPPAQPLTIDITYRFIGDDHDIQSVRATISKCAQTISAYAVTGAITRISLTDPFGKSAKSTIAFHGSLEPIINTEPIFY